MPKGRVAFRVVLLLDREGPRAPGGVAPRVGRIVSTVSDTPAKLQAAELVRRQLRGSRPRYWLKQPREPRAVEP